MAEIGFGDLIGMEEFQPLLGIHQPIFHAITAHDPKKANAAMRRHVNTLRSTVPTA